MADADADAASDLAELIANAPEGDGAAPDAARAKQLREALKRAHDRALARSRAAAASAALLGDHRRGAQVSELVLGDAETVWQQLRLRGRDGDRHAVAAEHYLQRQAEAADDDDESDGDDEEDDAAADDEAAAESESAASSMASSFVSSPSAFAAGSEPSSMGSASSVSAGGSSFFGAGFGRFRIGVATRSRVAAFFSMSALSNTAACVFGVAS